MSHDPYSRICGQYPFELIRGFRRTICDEAHSGVNAVTHSNASALMYAHPCRATRGVQKRVQYGPVSDSITTIKHTLGLPAWRGNASTVKMIPSNPDRPSKFPVRHHLVYQSAEFRALSESKPAYSSRQTLEFHFFLSFPNPPGQALVLRKGRENKLIVLANIFRVPN